MELRKKIKKLKLIPLNDNKRYELALNKSKWKHYKKYDYYIQGIEGEYYFYSKEYLESNSYRYLKKKYREVTLRDLKGRYYKVMKFIRNKFNIMVY